MADVTISSLPLGTPAGSNILPYSTGSNTLGVPVSAIFRSSNLLVNTGAAITSSDEKVSVVGQSSLQNNSNTVAPLYTINNQAGATGIKPYIYLSETDGNRGMLGINGADSTFNIGGQLGLNLCTGPNPGTTARLTIDSTGNVSIPGKLTNAGVAKAWVNWKGDTYNAQNECQINASYNISKVIRDGTGKYTVYFSTPSPVTNQYYVTFGGAIGGAGAGTRWLSFGSPYFNHVGKSTTAFVCECSFSYTGIDDASEAWVSVIGN